MNKCSCNKCNKASTCACATGGGCPYNTNLPNASKRIISQSAFYKPELDNGSNCQCGGSGCPCNLNNKICNTSGAMKAVSTMESFDSSNPNNDPYQPLYYYSNMSIYGENLPWRIGNPLAFYNKFNNL